MEHTWRWFGPNDPVTLAEVRQTGATGIVHAMHEIPNDQPWPLEAVLERKAVIEAAGLTWSVVESIPVTESIKRGDAGRDAAIETWIASLRSVAAAGIDVVAYNFMPILDWTRTDLRHRLPDGAWALRFDQEAFAAFELEILRRPGAEADYTEAERARAREVYDELGQEGREELTRTVIAGLPGSEEHHTLDTLRAAIAAYDDVPESALRANLAHFLRVVVPVAEELGVRIAIHPDDPPRPLLGLPRVVSTAQDAREVLAASPSPSNGLTFCTGSYGVREDNDLVAMAREFASHIFFAHLRSTVREEDPRTFHEGNHIAGDVDMVGVIAELVREERRRAAADEPGPRIPMRPDHGHQMLDDQRRTTNPGYPLIGRLVGLAELRGVETAVRALLG
ncbi:mannonate dehydratase [Litorihabitans aurantiacus]|uniref:Mannonate dehydratase n=1 Tax=Litorihabitans aurantiacus TaxID=1930061 RepID=A0AA38CRV3_9MICO|nr:mannonate dehydratase [Litorihabitans aurantiacus]GMA33143.1 mannonate dehydratase [Litorihabitans aurantiacus]